MTTIGTMFNCQWILKSKKVKKGLIEHSLMFKTPVYLDRFCYTIYCFDASISNESNSFIERLSVPIQTYCNWPFLSRFDSWTSINMCLSSNSPSLKDEESISTTPKLNKPALLLT